MFLTIILIVSLVLSYGIIISGNDSLSELLYSVNSSMEVLASDYFSAMVCYSTSGQCNFLKIKAWYIANGISLWERILVYLLDRLETFPPSSRNPKFNNPSMLFLLTHI